MGTNVQTRFDIPQEHIATAGHSQLWKIWPGKNKETGQFVSIWVFDKNEFKNDGLYDDVMIEEIYQIMKNDLNVIKESQSCSNLISAVEVRK